MEVTEFELTTLDAALFEIPAGLNAAMNIREMSKALSDANETQLVQMNSQPPAAPLPKAPGVVRIGVPEFTNKTAQTVDTRTLRQRLIIGSRQRQGRSRPDAGRRTRRSAEARVRAWVRLRAARGSDRAEGIEAGGIWWPDEGGFGRRRRTRRRCRSSCRSGWRGGWHPKENTESSITLKLVQPDGKQRLATTTKGKDGEGFSMQTGLGLAKFAGGMYLSMFAGPQMFAHLNSYGAANLGGMGMMGNPMLYQMQGRTRSWRWG